MTRRFIEEQIIGLLKQKRSRHIGIRLDSGYRHTSKMCSQKTGEACR